ncbi:hypothetical protein VTN96DRAFT_3841 [Rasamsonia emersonii]
MQGTQQSFLMAPPDGRASPETTAGFNRTISYPFSSQACLDVNVAISHSQQEVGLGIYHGGVELPFRQLRDDRSVPAPLHGWPDHPISTQSFSSPPLSAGYHPVPSYQTYNPCPAGNPSLMGCSGITTNDVVSLLSYSPDVRVQENSIPVYHQVSGEWPVTSQAQTNTPSRVQMRNVSHIPFFSDAHGEEHAQGIPRYSANQAADASGDGRLTELDANSGSSVEGSASPESSPAGTTNRRRSNRLRGPRRSVSPGNVKYRCTVCGNMFTRRSNCREHMKKHDPNHRREHCCNDCGKYFGRKTDLKRHFTSTSVHDGVKRFGCEYCGHRFARQDVLYRHRNDCRSKRHNVDSTQPICASL